MLSTKRALILALGLLCGAALACGLGSEEPTGTPPVVQMMPNLPGYRVVEDKAVKDYIAALAEGAALLTGNPEMIILIEKVDGVIGCYQELGAINVRIFSSEAEPLSAGVVAIADRSRLTDPATLFECVGGRMVPFSAQPTVDPCGHTYTLQKDGNEFYIAYVGTTQEICQTFCAELEGCEDAR